VLVITRLVPELATATNDPPLSEAAQITQFQLFCSAETALLQLVPFELCITWLVPSDDTATNIPREELQHTEVHELASEAVAVFQVIPSELYITWLVPELATPTYMLSSGLQAIPVQVLASAAVPNDQREQAEFGINRPPADVKAAPPASFIA